MPLTPLLPRVLVSPTPHAPESSVSSWDEDETGEANRDATEYTMQGRCRGRVGGEPQLEETDTSTAARHETGIPMPNEAIRKDKSRSTQLQKPC